MRIDELSQHPDNHRIYSPSDLEDLEQSLKDFGQMEPIAITPSKRIISGHRRYMAMRNIGWEECDVRIIEPDNEIISLIEHNRHRVKTSSDILNEVRYLKNELRDIVGRGRNARKDKGKRITMVMELSKKLGIGTTKLKQLLSISNYEPSLIDKIDSGEISVSMAYEYVRSKFIRGKNTKPLGNEFETKFKKLIRDYEPSEDEIQKIVKETYPYNFASTDNEKELHQKRSELIDHLEYLSSLDSREYMQVQKNDELKSLYIDPFTNKGHTRTHLSHDEVSRMSNNLLPQHREVEQFFNNENILDAILNVNFELPKISLSSISIIPVSTSMYEREMSKKDMDENALSDKFTLRTYTMLRTHISSFEHSQGTGRHMSFIVTCKINKKHIFETEHKVLGIFSLHSDSVNLGVRDDFIGWSSEQRKRKRECIVNMNVCVPTQPFGFNYLGGKFLSLIVTKAIPLWEKRYSQKVVAIITTSLHGSASQYSGMRFWKNIGTTSGKTLIKPFEEYYSYWSEWLKKHYPDIVEKVNSQSNKKQVMIGHILRLLNIKSDDYHHNHRRGVFIYPLYENYKEFLTEEIEEEDLIWLEKSSYEEAAKWWVKKSKERYSNLKKENRLLKMNFITTHIEKNKMYE